MEYVGDPIEEDELIALSGVGLCFPWRFGSDCDEVGIIPEIPMRTFGALGYDSEYYYDPGLDAKASVTRAYSKDFYIGKIRESIDAGRPVIGFGITSSVYACLITGYYDGGDGLFVRACRPLGGSPRGYYTSDWYDKCRGILIIGEKTGERVTGAAAYKRITDWAGHFRSARSRPVVVSGETCPQNEAAFAAMRDWLMNDGEWRELTSHEAFLKQSRLLLVAYYRDNLRSYLARLDAEYPGTVNPPTLKTLDDMSKLFPGKHSSDLWLNECVSPEIIGFAAMRDRAVREKVSRYVERVSTNDNRLQWSLFMPDFIKKQLETHNVGIESFEYRRMPAMRFIGKILEDNARRAELFRTLDAMPEYESGFNYDLFFMHEQGQTVDAGKWQGLWGRFMKADAPIPEGFAAIDLVPAIVSEPGPPYMISQFAYAVYVGDAESLHKKEGFDCDLMYDVTRNIILGDDVCIDYPERYWYAEVFRGGFDQPGDAYLFGVNLDVFSSGGA
jgi:hypothetical protein